MTVVKTAARRAEQWLTQTGLPLWSRAGVDEQGAFEESLDFSGQPDRTVPRRFRVQARQLYCFSEAALRNWSPQARAIAEGGFANFNGRCWAADGEPGFIHTLTSDLGPLDLTRDAYDHAFALFALAWYFHATGDERGRRLADDTFAFMDVRMADPVHGGVVEALPPTLPRRSNPHMHLLEACLAWLQATGEDCFRDRANALIALFRTRFFDPASGSYGEYFNADWTRVAGPDGDSVEPGHHFEWVWLLSWAEACGAAPAWGEATALYDFGLSHGLDTQGFAIDECDRSGRLRRGSRRAWPQTELIKAHIAMARRGRAGAAEAAAATAERFLDTYLATDVPGLWMDQFDAQGRGMTGAVPASTLYHVMVAFRELILFAEAG